MKTKIIQISVASGGENGSDILYALCEDGTLWSLYSPGGKDSEWTSIPLPWDEA